MLTLPAFAPVAAALAAQAGGRHWLVDLPACFPLPATAALALGATVLAGARRWWLALAWAGGAVLGVLAMAPAWRRAPASLGEALAAGGLRALTVNLERGAEDHAAEAIAALRERDPDILFLCELTPDWLTALAPALAAYPHRFVAADPGYYGTGLFARWPLQGAETCAVGAPWAPGLRAVLAAPGGAIGVLGVHTPRPGTGSRCAERDRALAAIPQALAPLPPTRLVLGDCNATPWNAAFADLLTATGLADAGADVFQPTWAADWPWPARIPIDHVLVTADLAVRDVRAGPAFGSDHLPFGCVVARR